MTRFDKSTPMIYVAIALLMMAIFFSDLYTHMGLAVWITYLLPLVLSLFCWRPVVPLVIAFLASVFLLLGHSIRPLSPPDLSSQWGHINRGIGAFTVWVVALICSQFIRNRLEVRKQQEVLRRSQGELEERTAELERRNRELQEFFFVASHDLNEPLRKIQTFGTLLKERSAQHLEEQEADYISRMVNTAGHMQALLNALLRYSRVHTKARKFRSTKLDDVVKDAVANLKAMIQEAGARLEIRPLPLVNGDPYQLTQLFQNLIANAVKYRRPDTEPLVKIYGEENNGACRVFVEDNGIGFDEKYMDKIFQPFQRLHDKNEYYGTGIGLAICRKVVERHKGTITAESTPGKGSTFIVSLPIDRLNPDR